MQNKVMIAGALVVVAVIGAAAFFFMSNSKKSPEGVANSQTGSENAAVNKSSIKSLLGRGENVSCRVKYTENEMGGTVYVAGDRVRGDFTVVENGQSMENHMIQDGEYIYVWSTSDQGLKMKVSEEAVQASPGTDVDKPVDLDEQVEMDCDKWSVDESMFSPPANVKFTDVADAMKSLQEPANQAPQDAQDVCSQITDPQAKAACVAAIGQ